VSATGAEAPDVDARSATLLAIRNALTLGAALLMTWSIALGIRVVLPRHLGPVNFGVINFADAFSTTCFVVLGLGIDQYIRKEVAVRTEHASDFYGGAILFRLLITAGIFGFIALIMGVTHRPAEVRQVVYLYAATQVMVTANATLSALLHAKGRVRGMSALSVATKVVWAGGVLWAVAADAGLWAYAVSYFASEAIETVALSYLAKAHLGLRFRVDIRATRAMLVASIPYAVTAITTTAYTRLDVSLLEFSAGSREVGLYGASCAVAGLTLLLTPLIGWVLQPMLARAAARSKDELFKHACRSMELILSIAVPASLLINLGADFLIHLIFGAIYAKATMSLRVQSTIFVLTYVAMVYAMVLVMRERAWALAWISAAGLVVNATLNLVFLRYSVAWLGEGGGGTGCAAAMLCTEVFVTVCMAATIQGSAFDRRGVASLAKSLGICGVVVVVHRVIPAPDIVRLLVDAVLYLVLAIAVGALRPKEMIDTVREAIRRKKGQASEAEG
jgi:O-antigen/teichoic acid export membrane protein